MKTPRQNITLPIEDARNALVALETAAQSSAIVCAHMIQRGYDAGRWGTNRYEHSIRTVAKKLGELGAYAPGF